MSRPLTLFKSQEERRTAMTECIDMMLAGNKIIDIREHLVKIWGVKKEQTNRFLELVKDELASITQQDAEYIIPMHLTMYEEIYQYFNDINFVPGKMKAMRFKEKLMGLHKEDRTVEINNKETTIIEKEVIYETKKLTQQEQSRLTQLLEKTK